MKITPELKQRIDDYFDSNPASYIDEQMHKQHKSQSLSEYGLGYFTHKKEIAKLQEEKRLLRNSNMELISERRNPQRQ